MKITTSSVKFYNIRSAKDTLHRYHRRVKCVHIYIQMPAYGDQWMASYCAQQKYKSRALTHLPLVPHICVSELGQHWFRQWLVAYSAPSHYRNQCWFIVNWTLRNKLQWNSNQNTSLNFSLMKMHLKVSSVKWRPFCPGGDELMVWCHAQWSIKSFCIVELACDVVLGHNKCMFTDGFANWRLWVIVFYIICGVYSVWSALWPFVFVLNV